MPRHFSLFAATAAALAGAASAHGAVIATFTFDGAVQAGTPNVTAFLGYTAPNNADTSTHLTTASFGALEALNGTYVPFSGGLAAFETLATNGFNNQLFMVVRGGFSDDATITLEQSLFAGQPGIGTPDLAGFDITGVRLLVSSYQSALGAASPFVVTVTLNVEVLGEPVPAPGAGALLAAASLLATRRRR